jgi:uncharacterized membrane protein YkvA (DUF1232 family)
MKSFSELLEEDVASYNGRHENLISQAPAFYGLMQNLLDDPDLPGRMRPIVLAALGYFVIPGDIISEELHGPAGYIDDIYVCSLVAEHIRRELKTEELLARNWQGSTPLPHLIQEFVSKEKDLLGDKKGQILDFLGIEVFKKG